MTAKIYWNYWNVYAYAMASAIVIAIIMAATGHNLGQMPPLTIW